MCEICAFSPRKEFRDCGRAFSFDLSAFNSQDCLSLSFCGSPVEQPFDCRRTRSKSLLPRRHKEPGSRTIVCVSYGPLSLTAPPGCNAVFWVKNLATLPFVPVVVLDLEASPAEGNEPGIGGRASTQSIDRSAWSGTNRERRRGWARLGWRGAERWRVVR